MKHTIVMKTGHFNPFGAAGDSCRLEGSKHCQLFLLFTEVTVCELHDNVSADCQSMVSVRDCIFVVSGVRQ